MNLLTDNFAPHYKSRKHPGRKLTEPIHPQRRLSSPSKFVYAVEQRSSTYLDKDENCISLSQSFSTFSFTNSPSKNSVHATRINSHLHNSSGNNENLSASFHLPTVKEKSLASEENKILGKISSRNVPEVISDNLNGSQILENKKPICESQANGKPGGSVFHYIFGILMHAFFLILFTSILVLTFSLWIIHLQSRCTLENDPKMSFETLSADLSSCLVGQEFATLEIINMFKRFKGNEIEMMWWVGPPGVGKTRAVSIVEKFMPINIDIHKVYSSLLPRASTNIEKNALSLLNKLHPCKTNLIIIEEFDQMNYSSTFFIKNFIKFYQGLKMKGPPFPYTDVSLKVFIILVGSKYSDIILDFYRTFSQVVKNSFPYQDLQNLLLKVPELKSLSIRTTAVPFLPLGVDQLKMCVIEELNQIFFRESCLHSYNQTLEMELRKLNFSLKNIMHNVIESNKFYISNYLSSKNGCKLIRKQLILMISHHLIKPASNQIL